MSLLCGPLQKWCLLTASRSPGGKTCSSGGSKLSLGMNGCFYMLTWDELASCPMCTSRPKMADLCVFSTFYHLCAATVQHCQEDVWVFHLSVDIICPPTQTAQMLIQSNVLVVGGGCTERPFAT